MSDTPLTLVVGAGITGLTAALTLARRGRNCLLLEREDRVGGLCRSFELDCIVFDLGPHVLFATPGTPQGDCIRELLAQEPCISRPFAFAVQAAGRMWRFPNHLDILRYPWRYKKDVLATVLFRRKGIPPKAPATAADELTAVCGPELYRLLFRDLFHKKTLLPPEKLHRHWLLRVERTAWNTLEPPPPQGGKLDKLRRIVANYRQRYLYPVQGLERLAVNLHQRYLAAGGRSRTACGPIALEREGNRIVAARVGSERLAVREVVWTPPVHSLNTLLGLDIPPLDAVSQTLVCLTFNRRERLPRPFVYTYHPDPALLCNRIYYPESIFRELAPAQCEGFCLEISHHGEHPALPEAELLPRCLADLERLGLARREDLRASRVVSLPHSMPVYGLDYQERLAEAYAGVHELENLLAVGRLGGHHFCLTPAAVGQGLKAADLLAPTA